MVYSKVELTNFNADTTINDAFELFKYKARLLSNTIAHPA